MHAKCVSWEGQLPVERLQTVSVGFVVQADEDKKGFKEKLVFDVSRKRRECK